MTGRTHALIGAATVGAVQSLTGLSSPEALPLLMVLATMGALLPDLDATESQIKRLSIIGISPFAPLALSLNRTFGHRGALHSLLGWGVATLLFLPVLAVGSWQIAFALSLGYISHLAADACTKSGIPLLYPRRKRYHLLPRVLRVTTGSLAEEAVFAGIAAFLLFLLLRQISSSL